MLQEDKILCTYRDFIATNVLVGRILIRLLFSEYQRISVKNE